MLANMERIPSALLPTPKQLAIGGDRHVLGDRIELFIDPQMEDIIEAVRPELERLGLEPVFVTGRSSSHGLNVLGRGTMPAPLEEQLSGRPIPEQSYSLRIAPDGITICALSKKGALHGFATFLQIAEEEAQAGSLPVLYIIDGPDIERRIISPTLTWYAGFARAGFGTQLWDGNGWRRFIDWCFRHKINALNVVMYGFWPFEFPEYSETVLRNLKVQTWSPEINDWVEVAFTHPNLKEPFLGDVIQYANARGIEVYAYIGMNSYSGGYPVVHPESRSVLSQELKAAGHVNNYDSMCTSREEVRKYLIASVRRIEELGFNGLVFEESEEVQWFCQCDECRRKYGYLAPNDAKHSVTIEMLQEYIAVLKPETIIGVRWLREPPIVKDREALTAWKEKLPERVVLFWAPGLEDDDREFLKWVEIFGRERIWSRNCEGSGFAASLGRIPYLIPDTFPDTLKNYAFQHLWNDILQFQGAVNTDCAAINGYGFEWYGHELFFMATAQYGWDCWRMDKYEFLAHASRHMHGEVYGPLYENVILQLPCIHETQICPTLPSFPFMPNKYVGREGMQYLEHCALAAERCLNLLEVMSESEDLQRIQRENLQATTLMARRMREVIQAGLYYNRYLEAKNSPSPDPDRLRVFAKKALKHAEEDYRLIKENYFDAKDHHWTGVSIGEYYIPIVINEYKREFAETLGPEFAPDETIPRMVGGESLPWEWLLEWGPKIAAAKALAAERTGGRVGKGVVR